MGTARYPARRPAFSSHLRPDMFAELQRVSPLFAAFVRAQHGSAFLGRMESEQSADERKKRRMQAAGDA